MSLISLFIIGVGLSMDAFAVSICKGLATSKFKFKNTFIVGIWFGGFQALMPVIGYYLGSTFERYITSFDHWIAFALLALIGLNMIKESRSNEENASSASFDCKTMLLMAIATSIDALAVGVGFSFLHVNILYAALLIGATTYILSGIGLIVGTRFGMKYKAKSELLGGVILVGMGIKIVLEHLGVF